MTLYVPEHRYQYDPANSIRTRSSGCTWITGAMGADAATGGRVDLWPDAVLAKVKIHEETAPLTPGWSLPDLALAMSRLGVAFEDRSGRGWEAVVQALDRDRLFVILQGDSDVFADDICSGSFDGPHALGLQPLQDSLGRQRTDDPLCRAATWRSRALLRSYAGKLAPKIRFGVWTDPVPQAPEDAMPTIYSAGGRLRTYPKGTPVYDAPAGKQIGTIGSDQVVYRVAGQDKATGEGWHLIDGGGEDGVMRWVKAS